MCKSVLHFKDHFKAYFTCQRINDKFLTKILVNIFKRWHFFQLFIIRKTRSQKLLTICSENERNNAPLEENLCFSLMVVYMYFFCVYNILTIVFSNIALLLFVLQTHFLYPLYVCAYKIKSSGKTKEKAINDRKWKKTEGS